jgi:hypothetical protein
MMRRTPSSSYSSVALFEALEQRRFLATDFAYAGIQYPASEGGQAAIVFGTGARAENDAVTGTRTLATLAGQAAGPIDIATMSFDGKGGMSLTDTGGIQTVAPFGADFRASAGYPIGFFSSEPQVTAGDRGELARYFVEQRRIPFSWSSVTYNLVVTRIGAQGITQVPATVKVITVGRPPSFIPVAVAIKYEGQDEFSGQILSTPGETGFTLSTGERLFFNNNANPLVGNSLFNFGASEVLLVDPDASDGFIGMGVGSTTPTINTDMRAAAGVYRGSFVVNTPEAAQQLGVTLGLSGAAQADIVVVLSNTWSSGADQRQYVLFRAEDYLSPTQTVLRTGTWSSALGSDTLTLFGASADDADISFRFSFARGLTTAEVRQDEGLNQFTHHLTGALSKYVGTSIELFGVVREVLLGDDGRPEVYHSGADYRPIPPDTSWSRYDLIDRAGGEKMVIAELVRHPGLVAGQPYQDMIFGVDVRGHAVVYERSFGGNWRYRDLTAELNGNSLASETAAFSFWKFDATNSLPLPPPSLLPAHLVPAIVGRDTAGALVLYALESAYSFGLGDAIRDEVAWRITDLSESLRSRGIAEPDFSGGKVTGFTTPWGSINIVGRDAAGDAVSLWKSPEFDWFVNNISDLADGARGFASDLTPFYTTWYAMNITGLDSAGNVIALWWTPESGRWIFSDLTQSFDLDPMAVSRPGGGSNTLTAIVNHGYGAISLAAFDGDGRVATYWWTPGQTDWKRRDITLGLDAALIPGEIVRGSVVGKVDGIYDTEQSYWGKSADGKIVRLFWDSPGPDEWIFQNMTEVAALNG